MSSLASSPVFQPLEYGTAEEYETMRAEVREMTGIVLEPSKRELELRANGRAANRR